MQSLNQRTYNPILHLYLSEVLYSFFIANNFIAEDLPIMAPQRLETICQSSCYFRAIRPPLPITEPKHIEQKQQQNRQKIVDDQQYHKYIFPVRLELVQGEKVLPIKE